MTYRAWRNQRARSWDSIWRRAHAEFLEQGTNHRACWHGRWLIPPGTPRGHLLTACSAAGVLGPVSTEVLPQFN